MRFSALMRALFIFSLTALMVGLVSTPVFAAVNEIVWKKFFDGPAEAEHVATDRNGNIIVTGKTGDYPAFVQKLSGGGRTLWTRQLGTRSDVIWISGVAVDSDGYIYIAVMHWKRGYLVSKYGPKGGHHWTRVLAPYNAWIQGIDVGPGGNIYIAGSTSWPLPNMTKSGVVNDAFIRKYNPNGKIYWTRQFAVSESAFSTDAFDLAVGPGGGVYVVGYDDSDYPKKDGLFLRKFSPEGDVDWTQRVKRREPYRIYDSRIAVDRAGGVTIASSSTNNMSVAGEPHVLTVKYSHKGKRLWTRIFPERVVGDVTVDRDRNVYIVGAVGYGSKAFVRKYNSGGNRLWTRDFAYGLAVGAATDSESNLYITRITAYLNPTPSFLVKFRR